MSKHRLEEFFLQEGGVIRGKELRLIQAQKKHQKFREKEPYNAKETGKAIKKTGRFKGPLRKEKSSLRLRDFEENRLET